MENKTDKEKIGVCKHLAFVEKISLTRYSSLNWSTSFIRMTKACFVGEQHYGENQTH